MARVALVTGGTEGIGAATCEALAHAGYITIAAYGHNDAHAESHIPTRKWDVGDYAACLAGVADVEGTFGDIDILINSASAPRSWSICRRRTYITGCARPTRGLSATRCGSPSAPPPGSSAAVTAICISAICVSCCRKLLEKCAFTEARRFRN
jgi:NAD(P)-dependent dehydrogenase (short-subunit alcohol dehydrogenase family)